MANEELKETKSFVIKAYILKNFAKINRNKGFDEEKKGNFEQSKKFWEISDRYWNSSTEFYRKKYGNSHEFVLWNLTLQAEVFLKLKYHAKALQNIRTAYQEFPQVLDDYENHVRWKKTVNIYNNIIDEMILEQDI